MRIPSRRSQIALIPPVSPAPLAAPAAKHLAAEQDLARVEALYQQAVDLVAYAARQHRLYREALETARTACDTTLTEYRKALRLEQARRYPEPPIGA